MLTSLNYIIVLMGKDMVNSTDYKELYSQYNWFKNNYPPAVQQAADEFFLPGFKFVLFGISKNINTLMDKDVYFVTKVRIDKLHDLFFRISEKAVGIILDKVLGKSQRRFNLNKITDLEAKIITSFNDFTFSAISKFLIPAPPTLKRTNFDLIHLTFLLINNETNENAKFIITLPEVLLSPEEISSTGEKFDYGDFASSLLNVGIRIGTTRVKLIDVKNIEIDDVVVLDNSDITKMQLLYKNYEKQINLNPNMGLIIPMDEDGGEDMTDENTSLWDSIEVEMNAQFESVKITLGELKNIENGIVVDLTSIYNNKITLSVENKPIASGELVIVNDRYGVKIDEIITADNSLQPEYNEEPVQEEEVNISEENPTEEQSLTETPSDDDEFDYSDFELEDEDI